MRLRLKDIKQSRIPAAVGLCPDDARLVQLVNEAQERLLNRGSWWGTVARTMIVVSNGCITWPRSVAVVLGVRSGSVRFRIHNGWYAITEYADPIEFNAPYHNLEDAIGLYPVIQDLDSPCVLRAVAVEVSDAGKTLQIQGYDENGRWIRTQSGGNWIDGEVVTLDDEPVYTTHTFSSVTGVIKDQTVGNVLLYGWNGSAETALLGDYEPGETVPQYRRSRIRGLNGSVCAEALVKLAHVPVQADNDWLVLQNLSAFSLAIQSLVAEENGHEDQAMVKWRRAVMELQHELQTMTGGTARRTVRLVSPTTDYGRMYGSRPRRVPVVSRACVPTVTTTVSSEEPPPPPPPEVTKYKVWYGVSSDPLLDSAGLSSLVLVEKESVAGTYQLPTAANQYLYWVLPASFAPAIGSGFVVDGFPLTGDLAGAAQGYTSSINGWPCRVISVEGVQYAVYRTLYLQNVSVNLIVS